jgi:membrane associated rhomboid family serine protease
MGVGDRAYMQNTIPFRSGISGSVIVLCLIVGFYLVGLVQDSTHTDLTSWAVLPEINSAPWQWFTYAFIHYGFWHLLGNALGLWWLGKSVEDYYGEKVFYQTLSGGIILGALCWWLTGMSGTRSENHVLIGISGGVYALMVVALMDRLEQVITLLLFFFIPVNIKARWLLIILLAITVLGWGFSELPGRHAWTHWRPVLDWAMGTSLAHSAHLGGFLFGWLMWKYKNQTNRSGSGAIHSMGNPFDHDSSTSIQAKNGLKNSQVRAELDVLLDKISVKGFGSLTESEKRRLSELSDQLK